MSIATWKQEFYKTPADQCPEEYAVDHSLQKWIGLRPENLKKHGLIWEKKTWYFRAIDSKLDCSFMLSQYSCALCHHFVRLTLNETRLDCKRCPLFIVRGLACNIRRIGEADNPYDHMNTTGDPEPMIKWLVLADEYYLENVRMEGEA